MSNFGTRLAYPVEHTAPRRADTTATTGTKGFAARVIAALTRALDEAPFDLAWPPSPRSYARRPLV